LSCQMLNEPPHHLRHAMPHAQHFFPGIDHHRRPLPSDRRRRRRLLLWPRRWGLPRAKPSSSAGAQGPIDACAALSHHRWRPSRRSRESDRPPLLCRREQGEGSRSPLCLSLFMTGGPS
jgi:hypothetical protein